MRSAQVHRWVGGVTCAGGLLWVLASTGHTFSHGSTENPREATVFGLESLDFNRALAIPPLVFIVTLLAINSGRCRPDHARAGLVLALVGWVMVAVGVILETWVLNPEKDFDHPLVLIGWMMFMVGLLPVIPVGMSLYGMRSSSLDRPGRWFVVVTGLLASLQWLEVVFYPVSTGSLGWDIVFSVQRGTVGIGWILIGISLWFTAGGRTNQP